MRRSLGRLLNAPVTRSEVVTCVYLQVFWWWAILLPLPSRLKVPPRRMNWRQLLRSASPKWPQEWPGDSLACAGENRIAVYQRHNWPFMDLVYEYEAIKLRIASDADA